MDCHKLSYHLNTVPSGLAKNGFAHGSPSELASVFLFAADNSKVEWRFSRYNEGNGDRYALGTIHNTGESITPGKMGIPRESEIAIIHSHPGTFNSKGKVYESM